MGYGYGYGYGFYGYYFQYLLFMLPAVILVLWAQWLVKSRYKKYSGITTSLRVTGKEMAERILKANGISNISVARISGQMTDNFNPKAGTIFLSDGVYDSHLHCRCGNCRSRGGTRRSACHRVFSH